MAYKYWMEYCSWTVKAFITFMERKEEKSLWDSKCIQNSNCI